MGLDIHGDTSMRPSVFFVACLYAVTLAGCSRTIVRETVVEKPVAPAAVIERPTVTRETIVAAPASCTLGSAAYTSGSLSCQAGYRYLCNNGVWERVVNGYC